MQTSDERPIEIDGTPYTAVSVQHEIDGWDLHAEVIQRADSNDPWVVRTLLISPPSTDTPTPGNGITTGLLQRIPLEFLASAYARQQASVDDGERQWTLLADGVRAWQQAGSKDRTPLLAFVALKYLSHSQTKGRGAVGALAADLAEVLGRDVSRETARDWISAARKREILSRGTTGRTGATPGPKLGAAVNALLNAKNGHE